MQGGYDEKFARLRLFFSYMMMHPGKKMTFMGCELGANREWRDCEAMEWFLLDCDANSRLRNYVRCLGRAYVSSTALWELDGSWRGFKWLLPLEAEEGLLAFERLSSDGDGVIAVMNFADKEEKRFAMELENDEKIVPSSLVNSDKIEYGGKGRGGLQKSEEDGRLCFDVPPLSAIMVSFKK